MKLKTIITTTIILFSLSCFSQQKKDTTVTLTFKLSDYRALINVIDQNIDSKKLSKEIFSFIESRAAVKIDSIKNELPKTKPTK